MHIDKKHLSFPYPGLEPEDPSWLDSTIDHLRQIRGDTLRYIEDVRAQADRLMSEATLADLNADVEIMEVIRLIHDIGRLAGPEFLHYLLDKVLGKSGLLRDAGYKYDGSDYDDEDDEDGDGADYADGESDDDEERANTL